MKELTRVITVEIMTIEKDTEEARLDYRATEENLKRLWGVDHVEIKSDKMFVRDDDD